MNDRLVLSRVLSIFRACGAVTSIWLRADFKGKEAGCHMNEGPHPDEDATLEMNLF